MQRQGGEQSALVHGGSTFKEEKKKLQPGTRAEGRERRLGRLRTIRAPFQQGKGPASPPEGTPLKKTQAVLSTRGQGKGTKRKDRGRKIKDSRV